MIGTQFTSLSSCFLYEKCYLVDCYTTGMSIKINLQALMDIKTNF